MKRKKKKIFILNYFIILILILFSFYLLNNINSVYLIKDSFNKLLSSVNFSNTKIIYDETLKKENVELKKKINKLNDITKVDDYENTIKINAKVIKRNYSYYYTNITINKGKNDNIKENMAVINEKGLVGRVEKVTSSSSVIKLITNKSNISAKFTYNDKDYYGIITKYDIKNNLLYMENVIGNFNDEINKVNVFTSGLNDNFKSNLIIGEIQSFKVDKYNLSSTIFIKPNIDINNITYVTVIGEKNDSN